MRRSKPLSRPWKVLTAFLILAYSGGTALLLFDYFHPGHLQEWAWQIERRFIP